VKANSLSHFSAFIRAYNNLMIINISRTKENLVRGINVTLKTHISVVLSEAEIALTRKYFNPILAEPEIRAKMVRQDLTNKVALIRPSNPKKERLKDFEITAFTKEGFVFRPVLEDLENAIVNLLQAKLKYLINLENWDSETTIEFITETEVKQDYKISGFPPPADLTVEDENISIADLLNEIGEDN
jgi:hypothetical protein